MKTKFFGQIFVSFLVLALGAWAFYEYKVSQKEQKQEAEEASLFKQDLKELKAFRIKKEDKQLEMAEEGKDWLLKQPVKDLASFTEISRWFGEIKNQKIQKIKTKENIQWEDYHLDKAPKVEMEFASGENISFSVSRKNSFDGKYFIKKGEELFIGERYFYSEVNEKDFDSFRSKKLMPSRGGHAVKIQLKGKENLTLHWSDYKWSLDEKNKKKPFPLDSDRLDGFWTDANSMKASSIKEAVAPSSLKKYGLTHPQVEIIFSYPEKDKSQKLKLSSIKEDKAFASVSHRDFIFEISKEDAEKLILSKSAIRDHAFPFNFKKGPSAQIERKSNKEKSFAVKKVKEDHWKNLNTEDQPIDAKKVEELLDKIKELKGEKYKKSSAKQNKRSIEVKNSEDEMIFELKEVSVSGSYSWVKTNLWDELVAVEKDSLDEIFSANIYPDPKPKEEKTSEKKNSEE